jgi:hypothetical protein
MYAIVPRRESESRRNLVCNQAFALPPPGATRPPPGRGMSRLQLYPTSTGPRGNAAGIIETASATSRDAPAVLSRETVPSGAMRSVIARPSSASRATCSRFCPRSSFVVRRTESVTARTYVAIGALRSTIAREKTRMVVVTVVTEADVPRPRVPVSSVC